MPTGHIALETDQPVDDMLVELQGGGKLVMQAKNSLELSEKPGSQFAGVCSQILAQLEVEKFDVATCRIVLVVGNVTAPLKTLREALSRKRRASAAMGSADEIAVLATFRGALGDVSDSDFERACSLTSVLLLDDLNHDQSAHVSTARALLHTLVREEAAVYTAWTVLESMAQKLGSQRVGTSIDELKTALEEHHISLRSRGELASDRELSLDSPDVAVALRLMQERKPERAQVYFAAILGSSRAWRLLSEHAAFLEKAGECESALGNTEQAAEHWNQAALCVPDSSRALAFASHAELLLGKRELALARAQKALALDEYSAEGWTALIAACEDISAVEDEIRRMPPELLENRKVQMNLAVRRAEQAERGVSEFQALVDMYPEDATLAFNLAVATQSDVLRILRRRVPSVVTRDELATIDTAFKRAASVAEQSGRVAMQAECLLQRSDIARQLADVETERELIEQAERLSPGSDSVRIRRAQMYLQRGDIARATAQCEAVTDGEQRELLARQIGWAQPSTRADVAEEIQRRAVEFEDISTLIQWVVRLDSEGLSTQALRVAQVANCGADIERRLLVWCMNESETSASFRTIVSPEELFSDLGPTVTPYLIWLCAHRLALRNDPAQAAELMAGILENCDCIEEATNDLLVDWLVKSGQHDAAIAACERARMGGFQSDRCNAREVELLATYDAETAIKLLQFSEQSGTITPLGRLRMAQIQPAILSQNGRLTALLELFPASSVEEAVADSICRLLNPLTGSRAVADYLYTLYRRFPRNSTVAHALCMNALLGASGQGETTDVDDMVPVNQLPTGCAVRVQNLRGGHAQWFIFETPPVGVPLANNEFAEEDPWAAHFRGKGVGQIVTINRSHGLKDEWLVEEVLPARDYRVRNLLEQIERILPESPPIVHVHMPKITTGELDVSEVMRVLLSARESAEHVERSYQERAAPSSMLARFSGRSNFECSIVRLVTPHLLVYSCDGSTASRARAAEILSSDKRILLDPTAASTAYVLGADDVIEAMSTRISVHNRLVDDVRKLQQQRQSDRTSHGWITAGPGYPVITLPDAAIIDKEIKRLADFVAKMSNLPLEKSDRAVAALPPDKREILARGIDPTSLATWAFARSTGGMLWIDDLFAASLMRSFGVPTVCTQDILFHLLHVGGLSRHRYSELVFKLLAADVQFVSLDQESVTYGVSAGDELRELRWSLLLREVENPVMDDRSALHVAAWTLKAVLDEYRLPETRVLRVSDLCDALGKRIAGPQLVVGLEGFLPAVFGLEALQEADARRHIHAWRVSRKLQPASQPPRILVPPKLSH